MAAGVHVVWLKRDLRTRDHAPLARAMQQAAADGHVSWCSMSSSLGCWTTPRRRPAMSNFNGSVWKTWQAPLARRRGRCPSCVACPDVGRLGSLACPNPHPILALARGNRGGVDFRPRQGGGGLVQAASRVVDRRAAARRAAWTHAPKGVGENMAREHGASFGAS